jgi:hypothetical protein
MTQPNAPDRWRVEPSRQFWILVSSGSESLTMLMDAWGVRLFPTRADAQAFADKLNREEA